MGYDAVSDFNSWSTALRESLQIYTNGVAFNHHRSERLGWLKEAYDMGRVTAFLEYDRTLSSKQCSYCNSKKTNKQKGKPNSKPN